MPSFVRLLKQELNENGAEALNNLIAEDFEDDAVLNHHEKIKFIFYER